MSSPSYIQGPNKSFPAGATVEANRLVKLSSGAVVHADATERAIGWSQNRGASGETITVRLINTQGTLIGIADGAITAGAVLFGCAGGKVNDTDPGSALKVGLALTAATADGDQIEVMPGIPLT